MFLLDTSDNFFVRAWEAIVNFFTVTLPDFVTVFLPDFFMNPAENWPWFIAAGGVLIVLIALIVLLVRAGKKRRRKKREKRETDRLAADEVKQREDEAAELARIRQAREAEVRANGLSIDELIQKRVEQEMSVRDADIEESERRLQETFAAESDDIDAEESNDEAAAAAPYYADIAEPEEKVYKEEAKSAPAKQIPAAAAAEMPAQSAPAAKETAAPAKPAPVEKETAEQAKPAVKKAAATADKEIKPADTVMYSIIYDRAAREWVVRKTGSPRAIRRLRTKAEALEYAEQLSARQGLALQVHKKDGKFQKQ